MPNGPVVTRAAIVSFRLGGVDGVSVVAESWRRALIEFGFDVVTVAGSGVADHLVRGLAFDTDDDPDVAELATAIDDADVVIAENILSIPLRLEASQAVATVLRGRPAIVHHHDMAWQVAGRQHVTA